MTSRKHIILDALADNQRYHVSLYHGQRILHKKSGNMYRVTDFGYLEASMLLHFTYEQEDAPYIRFIRPLEELHDGRFDFVDAFKP